MGTSGSSSNSDPPPRVQVTSSSQSHVNNPHRPNAPSSLRNVSSPPPEIHHSFEDEEHENEPLLSQGGPADHPQVHGDHIDPVAEDLHHPVPLAKRPEATAELEEPAGATATTHLLKSLHADNRNHGTFSQRPGLARNYNSFTSQMSILAAPDSEPETESEEQSTGLKLVTNRFLGQTKRHSTTTSLAREHGVEYTFMDYAGYYIPFWSWLKEYEWSYLAGDLTAALSMASFYIPMALSLAANLGHIPPINGLYSFVFQPLIYAFLGSSPRLVLGPEAAGSLLVGSVVRASVDKGHSNEDNDILNAQIAGVVTAMAGSVIFVAGIARLGFLDSVLSRPLLRGFISAVGFVIMVDQLIPELGLSSLAEEDGRVSHQSSVRKIHFIFTNLREIQTLTAVVSLGGFLTIMVCRELKNRLQPRFPRVAYIPDRFIIVVISVLLSWKLDWKGKGVEVLGEVKSVTGGNFTIRWPFQTSHMKHVREAMSTSFLIAVLGFFESSVAAKALGGEAKFSTATGVSANRELVALGVANIIGGCFMSLPAFGGYGRSKINAATGGQTPVSSIALSLITVICVLFLLPYFYYLPKPILSTMISVVAWSLLEEAPHDIHFFFKIRGWFEIFVMFIIFASTIFYSLSLGIAIGVGISVISVVRHATRPRIQILGRVPGTNMFENAENRADKLEFVEGSLIVKIPEPLTFANTGELKNRLRRLELHGTTKAHPSLPRVRSAEHNKNVIFDVHGVTGLDGSGAQVLVEIVKNYRDRGVRVFFCRVPSPRSKVFTLFETSGIVDICGGKRYFVDSVEEALEMSEADDAGGEFRTGV